MEEWQKIHIRRNRPALIESTKCTPMLITKLTAANILGPADEDVLISLTSEHEKAFKLYDIVIQRTNAYKELLLALQDEKQTRAHSILSLENTKWSQFDEELRSHLLDARVLYQNRETRLKDLLTSNNTTIQQQINELTGNSLLTLVCSSPNPPELIGNSVPADPQYYIGRKLQIRKEVSTTIFLVESDDVFVISQIELFQLSAFANGRNMDTSENQLEEVNAKFILLEMDDDFDDICKASKNPVHHLEHNSGKFTWVRSFGPIKLIRDHVTETAELLTEAEFVETCLKSKGPFCISDSPGMGKSVLLAKLGNTIMTQYPDRLVLYIVFHEFLNSLSNFVQLDNQILCDTLADHYASHELGKAIVKDSLQSEESQSEILLDGFDEVLPDQINRAKELFKLLRDLPSTRVYVTTRPHMRTEVETTLNVLACNILPFERTDQIEFLVQYWQSEGATGGKELEKYAGQCLNSLKDMISDFERDIAGIPLQCSLLAKFHLSGARRNSRRARATASQLPTKISSLFDMFKKFLDLAFGIYDKLDNSTSSSSNVSKAQMIRLHTQYALCLLFPSLENNMENQRIFGEHPILRAGILETGFQDSGIPRFVHRTFAEFLVALHCTYLIWESADTDKVDVVIHTIFGVEEKVESLLGKHAFDEGSVKVTLLPFRFPIICYFINGFIKLRGIDKLTQRPLSLTSDTFFCMFNGAVSSDFEHVAKFLNLLHPRISDIAIDDLHGVEEMVLLAAKYASLSLFQLVVTTLEKTGSSVEKLTYPRCEHHFNQVTPLHVAAYFGRYQHFDLLLQSCVKEIIQRTERKTAPLDQYLLHTITHGSAFDSDVVVASKCQMVKFLAKSSQSHLIHEKLVSGDSSTPILQLFTHIDLLHTLIEVGADINATTSNGDNLLHTVLTSKDSSGLSITANAYDKLISSLATKVFVHFNRPNHQGRFPIQAALVNLDISHATIDVFLSRGLDIQKVFDSSSGDSLLALAVRHGRTVAVLEKLVTSGADPSCRNHSGETVFHIGAANGRVEAIQYFIKNFPEHINCLDNSQRNALHLAVCNRTPTQSEIQTGLITAGINLNQVNKDGNVPLMHALKEAKGLGESVVLLMESKDFRIASEQSSLGLRALLMNKNISVWEWDEELVRMCKILIERGGFLTCLTTDDPWQLPQVCEKLEKIQGATKCTSELLQRLKEYSHLSDVPIYELSSSQAIYKALSGRRGSYEAIMLSLISCGQSTPFLMLRQCLQSEQAETIFATAPDALVEFLGSSESRFLKLHTFDAELTLTQIRDTFGPVFTVVRKELEFECLEDTFGFTIVSISGIQIFPKPFTRHKIVILHEINNEEHIGELLVSKIKWNDLSVAFQSSVFPYFNEELGSDEKASLLIEHIKTLSGRRLARFINAFKLKPALNIQIKCRAHQFPLEISRKVALSPDIFDDFFDDTIVFQGISLDEIVSRCKRNQLADTSINQLQQVEVVAQFISLDDPSHFAILCKHTGVSLHLVEKRHDEMILLETRGTVKNLSQHIQPCKPIPVATFNNDFAKRINLIQTPNEVYTKLFAESITNLRPHTVVLFRQLFATDFLKLKSFNTRLSALFGNELMGIALGCDKLEFDLVISLMTTLTQKESTTFSKVVMTLTQLKSINIWLVSCSDMTTLQNAFGCTSSVIQPIGRDAEVAFLLDAWSASVADLDSNLLREYLDIIQSKLSTPKPTQSVFKVINSPYLNHLLEEHLTDPNFYIQLVSNCPPSNFSDFPSLPVLMEQYLASQLIPSECEEMLSNCVPLLLFIVAQSALLEGDVAPTKSKSLKLLLSTIQVKSDIKLSVFCYPTFVRFLNECLSSHTLTSVSPLERFINNLPIFEVKKKLLPASVVGGYSHLMDLILQLLAQRGVAHVDKHVVGLAVLFGTVSMLEKLSKLYNGNLNNIRIIDESESKSLLRMSLVRGDHEITTFLLQQNVSVTDDTLLLHACIALSTDDPPALIHDRIKNIQSLLQLNPALLETVNGEGMTPLLESKLHIQILLHLISLGANVNAVDKNGFSVVHFAPSYLTPQDYHQLISFLIDLRKMECFSSVDGFGCSAIHHTVRKFSVLPETLRLYRDSGVDYNVVTTTEGYSVLHLTAICKTRVKVLENLVEFGSNRFSVDKTGQTVVHLASFCGQLGPLNYFLSVGCHVNAGDHQGDTPLHYAFRGNLEEKANLIKILNTIVCHGGDVNSINDKGLTPLFILIGNNAKVLNFVSAAKFLLDNGADIGVRLDGGETVLHLAPLLLNSSQYSQFLQLVLERSLGSVLNTRCNEHTTPLHIAVLYLELGRELLEVMTQFVDVNSVDEQGRSVITYAVKANRSEDMLDDLIRLGGNLTLPDRYGWTALHLAAFDSDPSRVLYCIRHGCSVNTRNHLNNTPLHFSIMKPTENTHEVVQILLENGASTQIRNTENQTVVDLALTKRGELEHKTLKLFLTHKSVSMESVE